MILRGRDQRKTYKMFLCLDFSFLPLLILCYLDSHPLLLSCPFPSVPSPPSSEQPAHRYPACLHLPPPPTHVPLPFFEKRSLFFFHSSYKCNICSLPKIWKSTKKNLKTILGLKLRGSHLLLTNQFVSFLIPFQPHLFFFFFLVCTMLTSQFINFVMECRFLQE